MEKLCKIKEKLVQLEMRLGKIESFRLVVKKTYNTYIGKFAGLQVGGDAIGIGDGAKGTKNIQQPQQLDMRYETPIFKK